MNRIRKAGAALSVAALAVSLSACGGGDSSSNDGNGSGAAGGEQWILGTTDSVTAVDPAGSYDFGSWNMQYNIFEQLVTDPGRGADTPSR